MVQLQRILILTDWFDPAYLAGGPIRSCVNLAGLLKSEYKIYVLTSDEDVSGPLENVESNRWVEYDYNIQVQYMSRASRSYRKFKELLQDLSPTYVYLNSMYSKAFSLWPIWICRTLGWSNRLRLAPRGMLQKGAIEKGLYKKRVFFWIWRVLGLSDAMLFHATDEQEREDIERRLGATQVKVISNVPTVPFRPDEVMEIAKSEGQLRLVYVSRISRKKNLLQIINLLEKLEFKEGVTLDIYGHLDRKYWAACEEKFARMSLHGKVTYKGTLSHHEVQKCLSQYHMFVLPTYGENFGHAIFEALGVGRPVLISDKTPWRNLESRKIGFDLALQDERPWIYSLNKMISMDQEEFNMWCSEANTFANNFISGASLKDQYIELFS